MADGLPTNRIVLILSLRLHVLLGFFYLFMPFKLDFKM